MNPLRKYTPHDIIETITSLDSAIRNRTLEELFEPLGKDELITTVSLLDSFRRESENLYHRVRASLFLFAIYRFYLIGKDLIPQIGTIPYEGITSARARNFESAIDIFLNTTQNDGFNESICSALADAYHKLAFKYLLDQVHKSIEISTGNEALFKTFTLSDYPYNTSPCLTQKDTETGLYPIVFNSTGVRMDPSHSGWSDIFFLGMDYPEGARVTNISIDLAIHGKDEEVHPPIESYCRMIDEPLIRITSADLAESKDIRDCEELFNYANDHLGLLKAGIVASGIIPISFEGKNIALPVILRKLLGKEGGFELTSRVRGIPKGSRLAVSTSLLACIITNCMHFSGQTKNLEGTLDESERRLVASRAILGEWLGGSGGGWQDSGGIWPGIKIITGKIAEPDDPEYRISRGTLLPTHTLLTKDECVSNLEEKLVSSIILVHGGMAQNVGPILEMVTEKYLLRLRKEWEARKKGYGIFDNVIKAIKSGNMKELGHLTSQNFNECITPIIPWVTNSFTEEIRTYLETKYGDDFWGFLMLGGMTGGGMAFIVDPEKKDEIVTALSIVMCKTKEKYAEALPFAMDPVIYTFTLNHTGIIAELKKGRDALMPDDYYKHWILQAIVSGNSYNESFKAEIKHFAGARGMKAVQDKKALKDFYKTVFKIDLDESLASVKGKNPEWESISDQIKLSNGFDPVMHENLKKDIQSGKISVRNNRLPLSTEIGDIQPGDVIPLPLDTDDKPGEDALNNGEVAVVTLAAGAGTRWTSGAGVVKAINPFVKIAGKHRSFVEIHIAKTRKTAWGKKPPQHVFTTSFLTHKALEKHLNESSNFNYNGSVYLSQAQAIGQKLYPTGRDLRFIWEETSHQVKSENVQKVLDNLHETLINWAKENGEGEDYTANEPHQRFYPPGHWHEVPNMLRNGTMAKMIIENPSLKYVMIHNADTLGAWLDPVMISMHINSGKMITFEVTPRRYEDSGGGLARVNGKLRLLEGLALPSDEDEFKLSYYSTLTSMVTIDRFLDLLHLTREDLIAALDSQQMREKINQNIYKVESQLPTYATIKEVKFRWGAGQEDVFPILQCEKLWGDISSLNGVTAQYLAVDRFRGQQLKAPNLLDRWAMDGCKEYVISLTDFAQ